MERKAIGKKIRFEVFKRDSFTCQYCGKSAPDVVLEIDHIQPVAKGGDNDIMNLVTCCKACNAGKGKRELKDDAVVKKRKQQLDDLQQRHEQLAMMVEWQQSVANLDQQMTDQAVATWDSILPTFNPTENGLKTLRKLCRKFGLPEIIECIRLSTEQYLEYDGDGELIADSVFKAFDYIERIAYNRKNISEHPYLERLYYIRGILRHRLSYLNEWKCLDYLKDAYKAGVPLDQLETAAKETNRWNSWCLDMEEIIAQARDKKD